LKAAAQAAFVLISNKITPEHFPFGVQGFCVQI